MIYLDKDISYIPQINTTVGDKIRFINQLTKEVAEIGLSFEDGMYILDEVPSLSGQYDYFILSGDDVIQRGLASALGNRYTTHYEAENNITSYNPN